MKILALLVSLVATVSCGVESVELFVKGEIDTPALNSGTTVTLANSNTRGTVVVPFVVPVPEVKDATLEKELAVSIGLIVSNDLTGTSVSLTTGTLVDDTPNDVGEFSWVLNDARDEATLTFYNESVVGSLHASADYTAVMTVADNALIETVPVITFPITVE